MVRPSRWAFFDFLPPIRAPLLNRRFIPLGGAFNGFLAAPLHLFEQPPDRARMVRHIEYALDERRHTRLGPDVAPKPNVFRSLG